MTYENLITNLEEVLALAKNKNEQVKILKEEVARLNGIIAELQEQIDNHVCEVVDVEPLNAKIRELEEAKAQLEEQVRNLQGEKAQLESDKEALQAEKVQLEENRNQLLADKAELQNQVVELEQAKLDAEVQHQAEVEALNAKIDELKKILATN